MRPKTVIAELKSEIAMYIRSYKERDGKVRKPDVLRTIAALETAIQIIKSKTKKGN